MTRIAIAGFQHETNTFAPDETTLEHFVQAGAWPAMTRGDDIFSVFQGLNIPISGFIQACPFQMVPILWAMAEPGGYVTDHAFDTITGEIVEGIAQANPQAVYLDLHGAMVTRTHPDAEAEILRRIRARMGDALPIVVSLDLHGNLSPAFFQLASAVTIYRTYPHTDFADTGARAAQLLQRVLAGSLCKAYRQGDFITPITAQTTHASPARELYQGLLRHAPASVDLALGFPPADIPDCGPAIFAYAETQAAADAAADSVAQALQQAKPVFDARLLPADQAVRQAMAMPGPVLIADPQDNPGAGGTSDTTGVLQALIANNAPDAVLSLLHDPAAATAAHAAGVGAQLDIALGGGHPEYAQPVQAKVQVIALSDGNFTCTGPMFGGARAHLGPMAALQLVGTGIQVVVGSTRCQNLDQEFFRAVGIEPADHAIVCVKSAVHFMADYTRISDRVLFAVAPGANPCDLRQIPYTKLRAGVMLL